MSNQLRIITLVSAVVLTACGDMAYNTATKDRASFTSYPSTAQPLNYDEETIEKNTEEYVDYGIHPFVETKNDNLSTFSIDVDTASYTIARRKLKEGNLPPFASVRVEEYINYFDYGYAPPETEPFSVQMETMTDPFRDDRHIFSVGMQGKDIEPTDRQSLRLTFLVDVSGSMHAYDKLPLAKKAMHLLVDTLREDDSISLVTYASGSEVILPPTYGDNKRQIHDAINRLSAGGSTAMSSGMNLAYEMAWQSFKQGGENRVVVLSDGDANVGNTSWQEMLNQIKGYADKGVTMSTIGLGMGNYKDSKMEQLANKGDGNNYYIDSFAQARRVFVDGFNQTMFTIARDVKIQVEFNSNYVHSYRLLGYENREIADQDFRNDRVDAGEVGAGHNVTALYELILNDNTVKGLQSTDMAMVRVRYEPPGADTNAIERVWTHAIDNISKSGSSQIRLAYCAATFAEILRRSPYASVVSMDNLIAYAQQNIALGKDEQELIALMRKARTLGVEDVISQE